MTTTTTAPTPRRIDDDDAQPFIHLRDDAWVLCGLPAVGVQSTRDMNAVTCSTCTRIVAKMTLEEKKRLHERAQRERCGCGSEGLVCLDCGNCRDCCAGIQSIDYKISPRPPRHDFRSE